MGDRLVSDAEATAAWNSLSTDLNTLVRLGRIPGFLRDKVPQERATIEWAIHNALTAAAVARQAHLDAAKPAAVPATPTAAPTTEQKS